ncbi:hypothetical protein [Bradyrhizobium sp. USDA 372]
MFELDPASFLIKPLRSAGIYAALVMAFERNERTSELKQQIVSSSSVCGHVASCLPPFFR